ncbi:MAG TPA: hypothetical protein VNW30_01710 [Opitutaceae bacterium]|jgi:hypothetical protein|nr:hypothetical protein [Opitutaceae bacterium]
MPSFIPKKEKVVRNYFVLPCCLLLLNLGNSIITYKAGMIGDVLERTLFVIGMVLFGSSLVAFVIAPAVEALVRTLHRTSRRGGGLMGEILFLAALGAGVFFLYYVATLHGAQALLPAEWRN